MMKDDVLFALAVWALLAAAMAWSVLPYIDLIADTILVAADTRPA